MLSSVQGLALVPADQFTIAQLVQAYNQTRVDYLVPMPMNAQRLAEYIALYDVALEHSVVATVDDAPVGLAMLGVRPDHTWITRLGVLPDGRRRGTGRALMDALIAATDQLRAPLMVLEVIKHNAPAYALFAQLAFRDTRELLVMRRPPGAPVAIPASTFDWLSLDVTLDLLAARSGSQAWTNECESFSNAPHILGLSVELGDGSRGWLACHQQRFMLSHLVLHTELGDPIIVGRALLAQLYAKFPELDTHSENVWISDPHLPAFWEAGFVESFRRIEMHRGTSPERP